MPKKVMFIFGTRPEAIKMAPLIKKFEKNSDAFDIKICITAQHRQMLDQILELFDISPDFDLNVMQPGQDLYDITSRVILGLRDVFSRYQPDIVLVHGDTSTSAVAALAAFYAKIKVGHVEAGLRTHDIYSPYPEEANRQIVGVLANFHFAPTQKARQNLLTEGKSEKNIIVTGNTVIDALFLTLERIKNDERVRNKIEKNINLQYKFDGSREFILVTGHRRENFGEGLLNICKALKAIAKNYPNIDIVYPVHLNPNVQKPVNEILSNIPNIHLIKPLEYESFLYLMSRAKFIITDSGGIQEEAPSLGKPVLVMRETTERPEAFEAGVVKLVGTNFEKITSEARQLLDDENEYRKMSVSQNSYGDGKASERIVEFLKGNL